ncbi:MAG: carboxypeptidase regulatory-like domain-containing protein [Syntrophales bacterium]
MMGLAALVLASLGVVWMTWNLEAPDQPAATDAEETPGHSSVDNAVPLLGDGEHKSRILLDVGGPSQPLVAFTGVFGRVLDERDQAVGDAFVRLRAADDAEWIRTNKQGIFYWQPPPESDVRGLTAQAGSPRHAPSAVQPVQLGVEAILHVGPGGTVRGQVVDATGAPVKGFLIAIDNARIEVPMMGGATAFAPQPFAQDDGSFELGPLQPGSFDLRAHAPDLASGLARDVSVLSGQVTSGIVIELSSVAVVRGRVTAASDGLPIERAQVMLFDPTDTLPQRTAVTDAAGEFRMPGVAAGRRSLRIQIEGFQTEQTSGIDVPAAGEVVRDVMLRLADPGERYSFQGIGVTLGQTDRGIVITQLMDGAPAARAGLQAGDVILTVDRVAATGMRVGQVVEMILGEAGVPVSLEIERNGQLLTVTAERSRVVVKSPD